MAGSTHVPSPQRGPLCDGRDSRATDKTADSLIDNRNYAEPIERANVSAQKTDRAVHLRAAGPTGKGDPNLYARRPAPILVRHSELCFQQEGTTREPHRPQTRVHLRLRECSR